MSDRPVLAHRGIVPGQVAEIIVAVDGEAGWRGSGYRVGPTAVLTLAHIVQGAASVQVRFDADRPGEWSTEAISCWTDPRSDLAVLTIAPRKGEPSVKVARFGRIGGGRDAVLTARTVGFPLFKLKTDDGDRSVYRDSHQADGSVAVLSNRRESTLEVTVPPPERDPDPEMSPWNGMSGAAMWVGDRIVGVIAKHHRSDGLGRLAAARLDLALARLDAGKRAELQALVGLHDVLPDVVPPSAGERVITSYQAQVRNIFAPDQLLDRDSELNELVGFCAGEQHYAWWQAGPWAGKSALMAWFVLHPPVGVDVVSFFVTARLAGQSDNNACTNALIEQLAALVGESPASLLTVGARQGTMLGLLEDAATRSREAGHRLLLVIDGLDEDSGITTGPSIAALLPRQLPSEVRVLVASRPHPPIPDDVTGDHPLRTLSPRQLDVSEHARDAEHRAKQELTQLLAGTQLQRDVLGLITAAGGGLTLDDLEELTGPSLCGIEGLLGGLIGRSVERRIHTPASGRPDEQGYLFAHETLQRIAEQRLGKSLASYRDQLHHWADTYRQRGWPTDTPLYLLRSYPRMLASSGDLPRLVACATDPARHDRMRSLTGGDALALTETSTAQQLLLTQSDPDLTSLALIAVQRDHLAERNADVPTNLPAVWAKLGQFTRAEALAHSIPDSDSRAAALGLLAKVVAMGGDPDRAETLIAQITNPDSRAEMLIQLAMVVAAGRDPNRFGQLVGAAASGDPDRAARLASEAEALIVQITKPDRRAELLIQLGQAATASDDPDWAARLASAAEAAIAQIINPDSREKTLNQLTKVVADCGDLDWAEALITQITDGDSRVKLLIWLTKEATAWSDPDRAARLASTAEALIAQITNPHQQAQSLSELVIVVTDCGDLDWAEALIAQSTDPDSRVEPLCQLATAAAASSDPRRAARLANEAEALITQSTNPYLQAHAWESLADAVIASGDFDRAEALIPQITDPEFRANAFNSLMKAVTASGDLDRAVRLIGEAEALIAQITDPESRADALDSLARATVVSGNLDRAEELIAQVADPDWRMELLGQLSTAATASGDLNRAEALSAQIINPDQRAEQSRQLAEAAAKKDDSLIAQFPLNQRAAKLSTFAELEVSRDPDRAAQLASEVEALVAMTNLYPRAEQLGRLAEAVAISGDPDRAAWLIGKAEVLIAQITDPESWAVALGSLVDALVATGDFDRAEALIAQITDPDSRAEALGQLAEAAAASGDLDRAHALIGQISKLGAQARALSWLALAIARNQHKKTLPVREHPHGSSPMLVRARHLLGEALATGSWTDVAPSLAHLDPPAVSALADELQVRWKLNGQADPQEESKN